MEFTGRLMGEGSKSGVNYFAFSVNEPAVWFDGIDKYREMTLKITVDKYREKRSLDANAYLWVLLQKMAEVLKTSKDELYLEILGRYGVFTHIIVKPKVVDRAVSEWRTVKNLGEVTVGGQKGIQLQCYFGSSTYDTKEMSVLLDGVVSECKELGIETLPPDELRIMKERWGV